MGWWLSIGNTTKFLLMLVICSLVGIMMMLLLMLELLTAKSPFDASAAAATVPIKLRCWVKSSGGRGRGGDLTSVLLLELVGGVLLNARSSH